MKNVNAGLLLALVAGCAGAQNGGNGLPNIPTNHSSRVAAPAVSSSDSPIVAGVAPLSAVGARDLGRSPSNTILNLAVTLRYRNQDELERLVVRLNDPASADYRHWLTNERFDERFAPAAGDYARTIASMRKNGFHITKTYANRTVIDADGTVANVERYFDTSIHRIRQSGTGIQYANVRPARAPADLRDVLLNVDGLDTLTLVHTGSSGATGSKPKLFGPVSTASNNQGYSPFAFSTAYDFPVTHGYDGLGRSSGVVIDADFADGDLAAFLNYFGVHRDGPATKRVLVHGGPIQPMNGDTVEATLDVETIVSNAPGTALSVYETPSLQSRYITDAYNAVVSDNVVDVLNSSFGGCDKILERGAIAWNAIALQGAAKGITFSASSGDGGGGLCANAPASAPNFVAVGGTALLVGPSGVRGTETGWGGNGAFGSGGGVSTVFPFPEWQRGVTGMDPRGRNEPDIAFDAAPYTGTALYIDGTWNTANDPEGGTSLASPLFVAAVTELGQVKKQRIGLSSQQIFALWKKIGYGAKTPYFNDITIGSSGPFYCAPGYDLVTGIGSIDVWNLGGKL
jgi:subtilase family serine protease